MKEIDNTFYNDIRSILQQARSKAYSAVNYAMVEAYWSIGKRIVDEEQKGKLKDGVYGNSKETLTHQNIGQMDMYVRMFDDIKRGDDDNPTIGIILCVAIKKILLSSIRC